MKNAAVATIDGSWTEGVDWPTIYERHSRELTHYLVKVVGDAAAAEDLMQDTFVRAIEQAATVRDRSRLRPWLYRIATNLALSQLRRRRRRSLLRLPVDKHTDLAARTAEVEQVRVALRSIAPVETACLVLRERGFTRREIATICNLSEAATKSRLTRGEANFVAAYRRLERGLRA